MNQLQVNKNVYEVVDWAVYGKGFEAVERSMNKPMKRDLYNALCCCVDDAVDWAVYDAVENIAANHT